MPLKRYCFVIELKEEYVENYIKIHKNPWREILEAIDSADVGELLIWSYKNFSIVYYECDDLNRVYKRLGEMDVVKRWNETVGPWFNAAPVLDGSGNVQTCEKIFDIKQQLTGQLEQY